jgi:hypothetical protein
VYWEVDADGVATIFCPPTVKVEPLALIVAPELTVIDVFDTVPYPEGLAVKDTL